VNLSDRGGAGPTGEALLAIHREDLERHERGEPLPLEIGDVRALDRETIDELGRTHGVERVASAIAAAATVQLANVKLVVDRTPSGERRLRREADAPELSAEDWDADVVRRQRVYAIAEVHKQLREDARIALYHSIVALVGEERADTLYRKLGIVGVDAILREPKHRRRHALACALEHVEQVEQRKLETGE
jgi:hypothetical protein